MTQSDDATKAAPPALSRRKAAELWLIGRAGGLFIRLLGRTWRARLHNRAPVDALTASGSPVLYAIWHGEMLPLIWAHRDESVALLISASKDGEIIARVAERLGMRAVRGSSTRGGARALLGMVRELQTGSAVAFTPDGPRGPAYQFTPGAVVAAAKAGAPIVLVRARPQRAWRLKSWDAFMIPKPFTRIDIHWSDPLDVSGDAVDRAAELAVLLRDLGA